MTRFRLVVVVFALLASCGRQPWRYTTPGNAPAACRQVWVWQMPERNLVERTLEDSRSADTLLTQARLNALALAAAAQCLERGSPPRRLTEIVAEPMDRRADVCTTEPAFLHDAWDTELQYSFEVNRMVVRSAGPDREFLTADDLRLPDQSEAHAMLIDVRGVCLDAEPTLLR